MLFDHRARDPARVHAPAIVHLDGSARLQTVSIADCPTTVQILKGHHAASGVPILCNTSANRSGRGFFPSAESAMGWCEGLDPDHRAKLGGVWCEGTLWTMTKSTQKGN
jgi:carbamoyltransferase